MRKRHQKKNHRATPKAVLRCPILDQAKSAVLNSLTSVDAQRGYRHAIDEFVRWYCSASSRNVEPVRIRTVRIADHLPGDNGHASAQSISFQVHHRMRSIVARERS